MIGEVALIVLAVYAVIAFVAVPYATQRIAWGVATKTTDDDLYRIDRGIRVPSGVCWVFSMVGGVAAAIVWPWSLILMRNYQRQVDFLVKQKELEQLDREIADRTPTTNPY